MAADSSPRPTAADQPPRVVAVIVAWNRSELLAQCLDALAAQTRRPDAVVVVDNASTDDSAGVAKAHPVVTEVVSLPVNTGGAGGFAAGIATAMAKHRPSWLWIMDDDTVPTPSALAELLYADGQWPRPVTVLASRADWSDGREHPMNTPRARLDTPALARRMAAKMGLRPIRSASFVSILIRARAVAHAGLPVADYFLWNDDFEYTSRLLRDGVGLYVPASRVRHLTKTFGDSRADPGPRFRNEVRNKVWMFTGSDALKGWEKLVYGGSTLRRWLRTIGASQHRGALLRYGWQGLREGLTSRPRTTTEIFAGTPAYPAVASVQTVAALLQSGGWDAV